MKWFNASKPQRYISETFAEHAVDPSAASTEKPPKPRKKPTRKRPTPVSVRFTPEERAQLEKESAGMSLSAHIRERLFGDDVSPRQTRGKFPIKDYEALAKVLSALGRSNLARDFEALAYAIDDGTVHLTPESEKTFREACMAVFAMRNDLVKALGLKP